MIFSSVETTFSSDETISSSYLALKYGKTETCLLNCNVHSNVQAGYEKRNGLFQPMERQASPTGICGNENLEISIPISEKKGTKARGRILRIRPFNNRVRAPRK